MLVVNMILLNKFFYNVFVSKDGELLLNRRFLFLSNVQFYNGGMNVFHHFVLIEGESDVDTGTIDELIEGFLVQPHDEVFQKYFILMRCLSLSFPIPVSCDIK
jgi:hypothetical protein